MSSTHRTATSCMLLMMMLFGPHHALGQQQHRTFSTVPDVMSQLREGWEAAGQMVGLDTTQGLPSFFSSSLSPPQRKEDSNSPPPETPPPSLFTGFLQMLGSSKINEIAANAVVFFARMIGSSFIKTLTSRTRRADSGRGARDDEAEAEAEDLDLDLDSISWAVQEFTSKAAGALRGVRDPRLSDRLQAGLRNAPPCVRLLVCRAGPLVRAMQRALALDPRPRAGEPPLAAMHAWLPSRAQLTRAADQCDRDISSCQRNNPTLELANDDL